MIKLFFPSAKLIPFLFKNMTIDQAFTNDIWEWDSNQTHQTALKELYRLQVMSHCSITVYMNIFNGTEGRRRRVTSIRVRQWSTAAERRDGFEWDVTPCVREGWGARFDRVWSKWAGGIELHSYASSSEMEMCGCQVPCRTLSYLIACRQVCGERLAVCTRVCSFIPCLL